MNNLDNIEINYSNFDYDYYIQGMISGGFSEKSANVMLSNLIYSKINFINLGNSINDHKKIVSGVFYKHKMKIDDIIFKEKKKEKLIELIDEITLAFQSVAFESDKLILNKKYDNGISIKLTDDYILNKLEEKGYLNSHLELIQPFEKTMLMVSSLNEKVENLFRLDKEYIVTIKAYIDLEILVSNIDSNISKELLKVGLVEEDLIWLIPYKQIIIEAYSICFLNYCTIDIAELDSRLRYFVLICIRKIILNRLTVKSKKHKRKIDVEFIKGYLENIEDNINYAKKIGKDISSSIEAEFLSICNKYFSPDFLEIYSKNFLSFEQFMKFSMSNNFDSILRDIYTHHSYDNIPFKSESVKLRAFYKLFSLMMPHREWDCAPEYIKSQPQEITRKMRKFITKK